MSIGDAPRSSAEFSVAANCAPSDAATSTIEAMKMATAEETLVEELKHDRPLAFLPVDEEPSKIYKAEPVVDNQPNASAEASIVQAKEEKISDEEFLKNELESTPRRRSGRISKSTSKLDLSTLIESPRRSPAKGPTKRGRPKKSARKAEEVLKDSTVEHIDQELNAASSTKVEPFINASTVTNPSLLETTASIDVKPIDNTNFTAIDDFVVLEKPSENVGC